MADRETEKILKRCQLSGQCGVTEESSMEMLDECVEGLFLVTLVSTIRCAAGLHHSIFLIMPHRRVLNASGPANMD